LATAVIIAGSTGTGKTTSIRGLDPNKTIVIQVNKEKGYLPWPKSKNDFNYEKKNLFAIKDYSTVISYLKNISDKRDDIENIVIDDAIYIMRGEFFDRSKEKGFDKFTELADHFRSIITTIGNLRNDMNVFLMMHVEPVMSDGTLITYKLSSVGKLLEEKSNPMECVSIALFSTVIYDEGNKPSYWFYTNRTIDKQGAEIPAKSPAMMFEDMLIPNDLGKVVEAIKEYY